MWGKKGGSRARRCGIYAISITKALLEAGFQFDPENPMHRESGNASRYTLYRLPYPAYGADISIRENRIVTSKDFPAI